MMTLEDILGLDKVPPYLTIKQISDIFQIDKSTARRRAENKEYRGAFKLGNDWRIPSRYLEKQIRDAEERGEFAA
jgi:hypothetical protein